MNVTKNTQTVRKGISKKEAYILSTLAGEKRTIIELDDISKVANTSYAYTKVIANRLCNKKWLLPITRGKYLISPLSAGAESEYTEHEFVIAAYIAKNDSYYIAYWNGLNYYGYTEQTPSVVFVATTRRIPAITVHNIRYEFVTIVKNKLFGTNIQMIGRYKIQISDREKTIVDALDHPEYCGGIEHVAKCLWNATKNNEISIERIIEYARMVQNNTVIKRFGYLVDILEIKVPDILYKQMLNLIGSGYSLLDTHSIVPPEKSSNKRWKLIVNANYKSILECKFPYV